MVVVVPLKKEKKNLEKKKRFQGDESGGRSTQKGGRS
jgi:hypothetical protein